MRYKLTEPVIFFILSICGNFFNYAFNIVMARLLKPEEYGEMLALLSMLVIISVPFSSLQTVITKYVSDFYAHEKINLIKKLFTGILKNVFIFAFVCTIFLLLIRNVVVEYLHLESSMPVIVTSTVIIPFIISPIPQVIFQGLQKFYIFGIMLAGGSFLRLVFGVVLVILGFGVSGAIFGTTLSSIIVFFIAVLILKKMIFTQQNSEKVHLNFSEIYGYTWPVLIGQVGIISLTSMDIILVKHFFSASLAGQYAGAQIIGKIIFFFQLAIPMVMFPKAAFQHAKEKDPYHYLLLSLFLVIIISGIMTLCYFLIPGFLINTFFGSKYSESIPFLGWIGISMTFFTLSYILIFYQLSIKQKTFVYILIPIALLQIILLYIFHSNLYQVIAVSILCGFLLTILNIIFLFFKRFKYERA